MPALRWSQLKWPLTADLCSHWKPCWAEFPSCPLLWPSAQPRSFFFHEACSDLTLQCLFLQQHGTSVAKAPSLRTTRHNKAPEPKTHYSTSAISWRRVNTPAQFWTLALLRNAGQSQLRVWVLESGSGCHPNCVANWLCYNGQVIEALWASVYCHEIK